MAKATFEEVDKLLQARWVIRDALIAELDELKQNTKVWTKKSIAQAEALREKIANERAESDRLFERHTELFEEITGHSEFAKELAKHPEYSGSEK
jgi:rRNA-processing protein FCF1